MKRKEETGFIVSLDGKSLTVVALLLFLSAVIVFYLGVIFGKADRDPNAADCRPVQIDMLEDEAAPNIPIKDLKIFDIRDKDRTKEKRKLPKAVKSSESNAKSGSGVFTVQVLSTGSVEKAERFADRLKAEGFDAYLSEFSVNGKSLRRVRVGRITKSETSSLKERLKNSAALRNTEMEFRVFKVK